MCELPLILLWGATHTPSLGRCLWLGQPRVHVLLPSAMAKFAGPRLPLVIKTLLSTQSSVYEAQRVTSTAFLAEVSRVLLGNLSAVCGGQCGGRRGLVVRAPLLPAAEQQRGKGPDAPGPATGQSGSPAERLMCWGAAVGSSRPGQPGLLLWGAGEPAPSQSAVGPGTELGLVTTERTVSRYRPTAPSS